MPDLMNTREVAEYLRIKERKVYDLVQRKQIPCTRVTGKWLFPKHMIDLWLAEASFMPGNVTSRATQPINPPPVIAGSHDPLLDWALLQSDCQLAMTAGGSLDGLNRFFAGQAMASGLHVIDGKTGAYNIAAVARAQQATAVPGGLVLVEWARRQQGLVLAPGNPLGISTFADLAKKKARIVVRQPGAGSRVLFDFLAGETGIDIGELNIISRPALNETELALCIAEGRADAGMAVAAVAGHYRLDFIAIRQERYDLLIRPGDYFGDGFQKLIDFTRTSAFHQRAREMDGYDVSGLGRVHMNI